VISFPLKSSKASDPSRAFLPLGYEAILLEDLMNVALWIQDHAYLEPWHTLHPTVSLGRPNRGRLLLGHQMQSAFGLHVLQPEDSYTVPEVAFTLYAINALVRRAHPEGPDLMVLDISQENGGRFKPHRSHQNGADVDLRYYLKGIPPNTHKKEFVHASKLDLPRMWTFLKVLKYYNFADAIFMDHRLQKALYNYGHKKLNMDKRVLGSYLSYPSKGKRAGAFVHHISNHYNHMHVRLKLGFSLGWTKINLKEADVLHKEYLRNRTGFFEYVIQPGETLGAIAHFNQVRLKDLLKWNQMSATSIIRPGQILKVWR
jgi:hypothetical protein